MNNLFERTSSTWVRYSEYEWKKAKDGAPYLTPAPGAMPSIYDPLRETQEIVLSAVQIGRMCMSKESTDAEIQKAILPFAAKYGLFGLMTALPTTPNFMEYEAVYLPKNHFIKAETMSTEDYLNLFFPFEKLDIIKHDMESTWNIENDRIMMALAMTMSDRPTAVNMSFQREYAERYDWLKQQFTDWAFNATTSFFYYHDFDVLEEDMKRLMQIAYFTGLRIGEACGLTWQDIDLKEQCLTVRRSMRYNPARKKIEIGPTKRKKIRTVDFCDTLAEILRAAKKEQMLNGIKYGPLYQQNYYLTVKEKNRTYYEVYSLPRTENAPEDYHLVSFVCLRPEGAYESPGTVSIMCRTAKKKVDGLDDFHFHLLRHTYTSNLLSNGAAPKVDGLDDFHFHLLRHTYTSNLLSNGAAPKDVQELLGHADVSTTMNIYAHATREAKRTSARLLDQVVGGA